MSQCVRVKRNGEQCKAPAIRGGTVCNKHGGAAPQVKAGAKARLDREAAAVAVRKLGLSPAEDVQTLDPRDVLANELWRAVCVERLLRSLVDELSLDANGIYGRTYHVSGIDTGEAKPHVLWVMWMEERKHLKTVAAEAHRCGIEARRQELAEQTARQVADLFRAVFADPALGLPAMKQQEGIQVAARHLRLISS